ncbi:MAG: signal peptidase I [Planctomycetota bacterium]
MTAPTPSASKTTEAKPPEAKNADVAKKPMKQESLRDTVEAVAIAFILAFVFKTFEAEAFVIPTGSMAPTLYGRHKEVTCPACGIFYTIGASQEIDQDSGILTGRIRNSECPNCRHRNEVSAAPVFNGDRIVVNKEVSEYRRFDVVVFKNPEEPHVNYIKRLVGLPGEMIRIRQGDIQMRRAETEPWVTQRKEKPEVQRDIQIVVYDDRHPPKDLLRAGAEERWVPARWTPTAVEMGGWSLDKNGWTAANEERTYAFRSTDNSEQWLRYRHLAASEIHWNSAALGSVSPALTAKLVGDFCGFNVRDSDASRQELFWVKDLTIDANVELADVTDASRLSFEIAQGVRSVRCVIAPMTGQVELQQIGHSGGTSTPVVLGTVESDLQGAGEYAITFACVDDRVCLWIDDELVPFGDAANLETPSLNLPTFRDMAPIGISVQNMSGSVSELIVRRDIYYRNDMLAYRTDEQSDLYFRDSIEEVPPGMDTESALRDPTQYGSIYARYLSEQEQRYGALLTFSLSDDEYLMFGDNSPASQDSRLFYFDGRLIREPNGNRYAVKQKNLIGKALCIFWPHGVPFMNDGRGYSLIGHRRFEGGQLVRDKSYPLYSVPFYPNLSRMKRIR